MQEACTEVTGFASFYDKLQQKTSISGKSDSTLNNYARCLAHLALHFGCSPEFLDMEQVEEYLNFLKNQLPEDYTKLKTALYKNDWVVYAKQPFGGPEQVIEYLGRYTHKIAISNHRLKAVGNSKVFFNYKDYRAQGKVKLLSLNHIEFIRRFSQHILPKAFVRIRHFGILSSTWKRGKLQEVQQKMTISSKQTTTETVALIPIQKGQCPCCEKYTLHTVCIFDKRGPPPEWVLKLTSYKNINPHSRQTGE